MTTIILVRHGENDWVKKHRLAGWIPDIHLNENGQKQAEAAAERLAHLPVQAIYSSPVLRCMETAVYIANRHNLEITQLEDIGEVRYGKWEGEKIKKLVKNPLWGVVQFFPSRMRFPHGEALREVQFRAIQALEQLTQHHPDDLIVVVSHADLIKLVMAHYLGVHIDLFQRIIISPASSSVLMLPANGQGVRVMRINDDGPLQPPPRPSEKNSTETDKKKKKKK
ncbi:MAG: MSMEG_4193 family putative phosphomutase [Chloroflexota bacterium]